MTNESRWKNQGYTFLLIFINSIVSLLQFTTPPSSRLARVIATVNWSTIYNNQVTKDCQQEQNGAARVANATHLFIAGYLLLSPIYISLYFIFISNPRSTSVIFLIKTKWIFVRKICNRRQAKKNLASFLLMRLSLSLPLDNEVEVLEMFIYSLITLHFM